jgi:molybdopterin converting factor small subunit
MRPGSLAPSSGATTVKVFVPSPLRQYCGGARELALTAASVREALEGLEREHPSLYCNVCDETGAVRRHINVFVNSDHMRDREGFDTELVSGDTIIILPAVSGG